MREFLATIGILRRAVLILDIKYALSAFNTSLNPFFAKRQRPRISRHIRYTRDILKEECFEIGEYTYGLPKVQRHPGVQLKIGKFCSIADGVIIQLGGNHRTDFVATYPFRAFVDDWPEAERLKDEYVRSVSKGDVIISNDVWIGYGAMILSGVRIGDGAVIGAGAIVTRDVEPYSIVAGNPARLVRKRFDEETIRKLLEIRWWDWPIGKIRRNLDVICSTNVSAIFK